MTRKNGDRVMGADEKIERMEALYTYTKWGAYRNGDEDLLGTIEPGKLADLVVLGGAISWEFPSTGSVKTCRS